MRVLIACEFSGVVREAFDKKGHYAMSCDLLSTDIPGNHYQGDVFDIINDSWDLMIAHPPCTHLAVSGAAWFKQKIADGRQQQGVDFFMKLADSNIPKICIENPVSIMSNKWRKPDQIVQPYMFGEEFSKATCLWLKNLTLLSATDVVGKGEFITYASGKKMSKWYADAYKLKPAERAKLRSKTFHGIANAMAAQWG